MPRRWALLLGILAMLAGTGFPSTTTASAASCTYDVPARTYADAHALRAIAADQGLVSDALEGSVPPRALANGTSTTPSAASVAAEAGESGNILQSGARVLPACFVG